MPTHVVGKGDFIRPYRKPRIRHYPVAASQTILVGTPVVLSTTADKGNEIKKAGADPAADRGFIGFAAEAITTGASVSAADSIPVWLATQDAEFVVRQGDTQTFDNDDQSVEYGIVEDATNEIWRLDRTETTAKIFRVLEPFPGHVHGDVNAAVIATVIAPERLYHD